MTDSTDDRGHTLSFPCGRITPPRSPGGLREIGIGAMAQRLGVHHDHLSGHWCSRCQGLWYGLLLEAQCPVCGNRRG